MTLSMHTRYSQVPGMADEKVLEAATYDLFRAEHLLEGYV